MESLFNKVADLGYCEIFKNGFFIEHVRWLVLMIGPTSIIAFKFVRVTSSSKCKKEENVWISSLKL